jgi:YVTN family beta-propeller protein
MTRPTKRWWGLLAAAGMGVAIAAAGDPQQVVRDGVRVTFSSRPAGQQTQGGPALKQGELAEVRFEITEESTGRPVRGAVPAAWMDLAEVIRARGEGPHVRSCRDKIALYLRGVVGIRPLVDLNSYSMVVLNKEPSLTVIDPNVSMAGSTSTLAQVPLKKPGMDWAQDVGRRQLFVSMPQAGQVAVVDTESFKVITNISAGAEPMRLLLQPDNKYLWVGHNGRGGAGSGVTMVDADTLLPGATIATGAGHHEIAASGDSRHVYVSNRDTGTVTVIDARTRLKLRDVSTGPMPIALAWSTRSQQLYVADGRDGSVSVLDAEGTSVRQRIGLQPGIGPLRFTPDGRFAMVLNPSARKVWVIDASSNEVVHTLELPGQPYQVSYTRGFAYVRLLDSERVTMVNLGTLGRGKEPTVQGFAAGAAPPGLTADLVLADGISAASAEAAVFVVSPSDNTTYFYMEGMNAPSSNYLARGTQARAITVVDRSLKEVAPGVYAGRVKLPAAGRFDVAFQLDSPRLLHCFSAEVMPDPVLAGARRSAGVEYLVGSRVVPSGQTLALRFRLSEPGTGQPRAGVTDAHVVYYRSPGRSRTDVAARELGGGVYEALLPLAEAGAYYVHARAPSLRMPPEDLPFLTLLAQPKETP